MLLEQKAKVGLVPLLILFYENTVGLYTSPHLKYVRERIQINSKPISEESFARYFFKSWDKIAPGDRLDPNDKPGYFRFLTMMSFDVFLEEQVDVAIYETGIGGENDATNIIQTPVATGITRLGLDHTKALKIAPELRPTYFTLKGPDEGTTIENIAWHKSGIFKSGCPAFSVHQQAQAENVLYRRAEEKGVSLFFVSGHSDLSGLKFTASVQRENAALAIALTNTFLNQNANAAHKDRSDISQEVLRGLESTHLPGRCQLLKEGPFEWHIDGAHTEDSLTVAGQWYADTVNSETLELFSKVCLTVFKITVYPYSTPYSAQTNWVEKKLSRPVWLKEKPVHGALLIPAIDFANRNSNSATVHSLHAQKQLSALWQSLNSKCQVTVVSTVGEAVNLAREIGKQGMKALVTGSFHLVGAVLLTLQPDTI
ncbi:Folylpolyglutamate synthetase [Lambiella insularis]|nr:Folylpolyglutamate synthetase [Lambiella insularis]